jgi:alkaline phosphatase D
MDSWAGYPAARRRLLDHLRDGRIRNVVVVTGDEHQNYAGELRDGGDSGQVLATEFVATSISSGGDGEDLRPDNVAILADNPHCRFINSQRGYMVHEVSRDAWRADFRVLDQIRKPGGQLATRKSFTVEPGAPGLHLA